MQPERTFGSDEMICACVDLTVSDLDAMLAAEPYLRFEDLIARTQAGQTCTACTLSLEYHFTELARTGAKGRGAARIENKRAAEPLKQRVYRLVDKACPMLPFRLVETVPIYRGETVHSRILIANDAMFYETDQTVHPGAADITVRNADGRIVAREHFEFTREKPVDYRASDALAGEPVLSEAIPLAIGTAEIRRSWPVPTVRGTTRPQIIIEGADGCGGVHSQGAQGAGAVWYSTLHRPGEDRTLIAYTNCDSRAIGVTLRFPLNAASADGTPIEPVEMAAIIPAHGAGLYEVALPDDIAARLATPIFDIECRSDGAFRALILNASPDLGRISLDHPASG